MIRSWLPKRCGWLAIRLAILPMVAGSAPAVDAVPIPDPSPAPAVEVRVEPAVAALLHAAQAESDPAAALSRLEAYRGAPNALVDLAIAQAHHRQVQGPTDLPHRNAAIAAYLRALALDPQLHAAALGLAQLAAASGEWSRAEDWCARALDPSSASAPELVWYGHVAYQNADWQLLGAIISTGIMRFPHEEGLRTLQLGELLRAGLSEQASAIAEDLLARHGDDANLWRQLAWADQQHGDAAGMIIALEAATLVAPHDRELARRLVEARLNQGMPQAALAAVRELMVMKPAPSGSPAMAMESSLQRLAVRVAMAAGDLVQAKAWLATLPSDGHDRDLALLTARLAIQSGDLAGADAALEAIIALGERDPAILVWAGHLAESRTDLARAEALYVQASLGDGPAAEIALVHLAGLQLRERRWDDAHTAVATYLAKHPSDASALALNQAITAARTLAPATVPTR